MNLIERLRMLLTDTLVAKRHEHLEIDDIMNKMEQEIEVLKKELEEK